MTEEDEAVARPTAFYPPADITPGEFERFVTSLFEAIEDRGGVSNLRIQNHEVVRGVDGTYDFDATVRYDLAGMALLILVEAKLHSNPIKRGTVQVLHQKLQSVGAQKAVLVSTAPFQRGALNLALVHGIALVTRDRGALHVRDEGCGELSRPGRASRPGSDSVSHTSLDTSTARGKPRLGWLDRRVAGVSGVPGGASAPIAGADP